MKDVARFLSAGKYALAGVSRDPKKFGHVAFKTLLKKGMDIVPVNPNADEIEGVKCYNSVNDLSSEIRAIIIMTPAEETHGVARNAMAKGIKDIWIQQGSESNEVIPELEKEDINLIHHECILMFWKPDSIHSFHRFLKKIFGRLPA